MKTEATMGDRLIKALLVMLILAASCFAQTPDELRRKYGKPETLSHKSSQILVERYTIRPGIIMTVKFADYRRACEMRIEPFRSTNSYGDQVIQAEDAYMITEELAPASKRGRTIKATNVGVECSWVAYNEYERVMIAVATRCSDWGGGTYSINIRWKHFACEQIDGKDRAPKTGTSSE